MGIHVVKHHINSNIRLWIPVMCWAVVYFSPRSSFTVYFSFLKKFSACSLVSSLQPISLKGENRHDAHVDPAAHLGGCSHYLSGVSSKRDFVLTRSFVWTPFSDALKT